MCAWKTGRPLDGERGALGGWGFMRGAGLAHTTLNTVHSRSRVDASMWVSRTRALNTMLTRVTVGEQDGNTETLRSRMRQYVGETREHYAHARDDSMWVNR